MRRGQGRGEEWWEMTESEREIEGERSRGEIEGGWFTARMTSDGAFCFAMVG